MKNSCLFVLLFWRLTTNAEACIYKVLLICFRYSVPKRSSNSTRRRICAKPNRTSVRNVAKPSPIVPISHSTPGFIWESSPTGVKFAKGSSRNSVTYSSTFGRILGINLTSKKKNLCLFIPCFPSKDSVTQDKLNVILRIFHDRCGAAKQHLNLIAKNQ